MTFTPLQVLFLVWLSGGIGYGISWLVASVTEHRPRVENRKLRNALSQANARVDTATRLGICTLRGQGIN